jgi:hypothetical protein
VFPTHIEELGRQRRVSEIHLKRFVASLCGKPAERVPPEKLTDIPTAAQRTRCRVEHIVELILAGRLIPGRRSGVGAGFKSAGVDLRKLRKLLDPPCELGLSVGNAAAALQLSTSTITKSTNAAVLKIDKFDWPVEDRSIELVTASSVSNFRSNYISLAELSSIKKRSPGPLALHLAAKHIAPTTLVNGGSRIYQRADFSSI